MGEGEGTPGIFSKLGTPRLVYLFLNSSSCLWDHPSQYHKKAYPFSGVVVVKEGTTYPRLHIKDAVAGNVFTDVVNSSRSDPLKTTPIMKR